MGVNFNPNIYFDISKFFEEKEEAILSHVSQNPKKFFQAIKLMNRFRSAQCNYSEGFYAECYKIEPIFPFVDIRQLLPPGPKYNSYYNGNINSFL